MCGHSVLALYVSALLVVTLWWCGGVFVVVFLWCGGLCCGVFVFIDSGRTWIALKRWSTHGALTQNSHT